MEHLKSKIEDKLLEVFIQAQSIFNRTFDIPTIDFSLKGRVAGQAYGVDRLRFNLELCRDNEHKFLAGTVTPEIAHYINHILNGYNVQSHGQDWNIMVKLGAEPTRCHDYDCSNISTRGALKHKFSCACDKPILLTAFKAKKYHVYTCRVCHSKLTPIKGD